MKVKDLATKKIVTIDVDRNLRDALKLMRKNRISRLLVTDNDKIVGIITERDIADRLGFWKERKISDAHIHVSAACSYNLLTIDANASLGTAAELMLRRKISSLLVTENGKPIGILTKTDLIKSLRNIKVLVEKYMSKNTFSLYVGATLLEARKLMFERGVKRVPILLKDKIVGIVTEADIANALGAFRKLAEGKQWDEKLKKINVEEVMSKEVLCVSPNDSLAKVVEIMLRENISGLPVVENEKLVGIITKTDLIKAVKEFYK